METQWQAGRSMLRRLMQTEPTWTQRDYAEAIGRSVAWVEKWIKRLRATRRCGGAAQPRLHPQASAAQIESDSH